MEHFLHLLEGKDGVSDRQCFMERSTPNMQYKAWRNDPEVDAEVQFVYKLAKIMHILHYLLICIFVNQRHVYLVVKVYLCYQLFPILCSPK